MMTMAWMGFSEARMRAAHMQPAPVGGRGLADKGALAGMGKGL